MTPRIVVLALAVCGLATAHASADSIVYEKDGNVWQAEPDGTRQTQVTTTGGYAKPTQADDGTIIAVKDGLLHRMDRGGRLLNTAGERGAGSGAGPITPHLAPNGGLVAYNYFYLGTMNYALSHATRETAHEEIHHISGRSNPTWIGNERVLLFDGSEPFSSAPLLYRVGESGTSSWYDDGLNPTGGEVDASQTRYAATDGTVIRLYRLNQPPPSLDVSPKCDLVGPVGSFFRPSWSPDGGALAWQEDDGIWAGSINLDDPACAGGARVIISGGKAPDWGPADVSTPAAGGGPAGDGGPTGGGTGTVAAPVVSATIPKKARRRSLLRGLRIKAGCDRACRVTADLRLDRKTAKRLRLGRRIARKRASTAAAGKVTLRLRPVAKARRRMRSGTVRSVTVVVRAVDAAGVPAVAVKRRVAIGR